MSTTPQDNATLTHHVTSDDVGQRLDRWLASHASVSRSAVQQAIDRQLVLINNRPASKGHTLQSGQTIVYPAVLDQRTHPPSPNPALTLTVLNQSNDWLVVDKPIGMAVHPLSPEEQATALNAVVTISPQIIGVGEGGLRSGVVHRLDLPTSGTLLFATSQQRWEQLRQAFATHAITKRYTALVQGQTHFNQSTISLRLSVRQHRPARVAVVSPSQPGSDCSLTLYTIGNTQRHSLVAIDLHTGFLHQIRVTMAHLGHPVIGDTTYNSQQPHDAASRLMLHAHELMFEDINALSPATFTLDSLTELDAI